MVGTAQPAQHLQKYAVCHCPMDELPQQEIIYVIVAGTMGMLLLVGQYRPCFVAVYQKRILSEQHKQKRLDEMYQLKMAELQLESQGGRTQTALLPTCMTPSDHCCGASNSTPLFSNVPLTMTPEQRQSYVELMSALDTANLHRQAYRLGAYPTGFPAGRIFRVGRTSL